MGQQVTGQAQGVVLNISQKAGSPAAISTGWHNELLKSDLLPRYTYLGLLGKVFYIAAAGANPTGFTGGAAGTPLLGVMNPLGSGVNLVFLVATIGIRTEGTGIAGQDFALYTGLSALPTGTVTAPTNSLSQQTSGSGAKGFVNTAMTGSTAINLAASLLSIGVTPGATATKDVVPGIFDLSGFAIAAPGTLVALGASGTGTAASMDCSLFWAELPV